MSDVNKEIDEMAENMEKSTQTPKERLIETIRQLGPEGLRAKLSILNKSDKELLFSTLEEMTKAVSMDDQYQAKYVQGNIKDTILQEDKADDDQDEKLVKPEAAKMNHQGTPTEGWEGQVIKGEDMKDEKKEKKMSEKMADAVDEIAEGEAKEEVKEHEKEMHKKDKKMKKSEDEELREKLAALKKSVEEELGSEATPELVKAEMKKRILKEEEQSGDAPKMDEKTRAKKEKVEELEGGEDNKEAQKKVDSKMVKKAIWGDENRMFKSNFGGRNHSFSVNQYYDEIVSESEKPEQEEVKKSEGEKKEDLNDIIEKGGDATWDDVKTERILKSNKDKINGHTFKTVQDGDIASALGLSEEDAKKILGE